jgi:N-alpha-acetyl-L-2,4-diaminobutyrate deacetylase
MRSEPLEVCLSQDPYPEPFVLAGTRYVLGNGIGPRVLLTASLHGDEPTSTATLWYLAEHLEKSTLNGVVTTIPCVNLLAQAASTRLIPLEETDLNRCFPGRPDGSLGERLAATLSCLLADYDALIDVHTAGWCIPFVLLDNMPAGDFAANIARWASAAKLPVVGEMAAELAEQQGLGRSWSAHAISRQVPAITLELCGFRTLNSQCAQAGARALLDLLAAVPALSQPAEVMPLISQRQEQYVDAAGLFEAFRSPGDNLSAGETIGLVRARDGAVRQTIRAARDGLLLALQPISAVHVGSWLATIASHPPEEDP